MSIDTPYRSPSDAFAATATRRPDAPFLLAPASAGLPYAPEGFRIEYGAFKTEVDRLRAEYAAAGYGRGARVALLLENRPVFHLEDPRGRPDSLRVIGPETSNNNKPIHAVRMSCNDDHSYSSCS